MLIKGTFSSLKLFLFWDGLQRFGHGIFLCLLFSPWQQWTARSSPIILGFLYPRQFMASPFAVKYGQLFPVSGRQKKSPHGDLVWHYTSTQRSCRKKMGSSDVGMMDLRKWKLQEIIQSNLDLFKVIFYFLPWLKHHKTKPSFGDNMCYFFQASNMHIQDQFAESNSSSGLFAASKSILKHLKFWRFWFKAKSPFVGRLATGFWNNQTPLGGGFKYFLFSPLFGEDSQFWLIFFKWVETTN